MPEVPASALPEKSVLSTDGREPGAVHGLTIEQRTGSSVALLVEPNGNASEFDGLETTERGYVRTPPTAISGSDDRLIVTGSG